jgi:3-hydroxyisobutyrate dehydrogenase-like beta-hydroxyacid dehydrogenase
MSIGNNSTGEIDMTIKTVGLIGAGLMGHGIGKNIVEKGFALNVMAHNNRAPVDDLVRRGAAELPSLAEIAAQSDMVILCVTGSPQVEETVRGLMLGARKGLVIADCSTSIPDSTKALAIACAKSGIDLVDTPMTRTPNEAEAGTLGLMVGGDSAIINRIRPVLETFSNLIVHTGAVGTGHQMKLINNFLSMGHAAMAAEAIAVAAKANIDMAALRDVIMGGGAASVMFGRLINVPLHDDDSHAKFAIRNGRKDLRYYTNMTENLSASSFLAETVHQTFVVADNLGYGDRYIPRLIDVMMRLNGKQ